MFKRMLFIQGGTVNCSKECYLFKEEQCNVQKNAIYSRRSSEMYKECYLFQGGTVKCSKECYLFKEEQ